MSFTVELEALGDSLWASALGANAAMQHSHIAGTLSFFDTCFFFGLDSLGFAELLTKATAKQVIVFFGVFLSG